MQKIRNSSALYHNTNNPFAVKPCKNIGFWLLWHFILFSSLFRVGIPWDCTILSEKPMRIISRSLADVFTIALRNFPEFLPKWQSDGLDLYISFVSSTRVVTICCNQQWPQSRPQNIAETITWASPVEILICPGLRTERKPQNQRRS